MMKEYIFFVLMILSLLIPQGCKQKSNAEFKKKETIQEDFTKLIQIADKEAQKVLIEFNKSKFCQKSGGPFYLDDYKKEIKEDVYDNRPGIWVFYKLIKPVLFRGHPQHFSIWIYKDNLETEVFGGE